MGPPSDHDQPWKRALISAGSASRIAGRFIARKSAEAYQAVDPDVRRHIGQLPLMTYSLFLRRDLPVEAGVPDGHPPLVFVHGLGGGRGDFGPMAWYLRRMGRKRSYSVAFETGQGIPGRAEALAAFVREVLEVTGEPQVDMVAHSLGGVAARLAIQEHGLGRAVRTLITLGAPHNGTLYARLGNTSITRDLRPDSPLLRALAAKPLPRTLRAVSFWSRGDVVILPAESAALPGSIQIEAPNYTHYGYLVMPSSWKAVLEALSSTSGGDE